MLIDTMHMRDVTRSGALTGRRVLVAEDDYFLADDIVAALREAGAHVIGPVPTLAEAMVHIRNKLDAAVLDIGLRGTLAWPIAETLLARHVPFMFATGYGSEVVPTLYADVPYWVKPLDAGKLIKALSSLIGHDVMELRIE